MLATVLLAAAVTTGSADEPVTVESVRPLDHRLLGRVVTADGEPVHEASVELRAVGAATSVAAGATRTAPDGRFELEVHDVSFRDVTMHGLHAFPEDWSLLVEAPHFAPSRIDRLLWAWGPSYSVGDVVLHRPVPLSGRVTTTGGAALAGATVLGAPGHRAVETEPYDELHFPDRTLGLRELGKTDANGSFTSTALPPGPVFLVVLADGYLNAVRNLGLDSTTANRIEVALEPAEPIRFRVTTPEGSPVPDAIARCTTPVLSSDTRRLLFAGGPWAADSNGWIEIDGLESGAIWNAEVLAPGRSPGMVGRYALPDSVVLGVPTELEVRAVPREDGSLPSLYQVNIREGKSPALLFCGTGEDRNWAELRADHPAVEVVSPSHWRILWNSESCILQGGRPGNVGA